MSIPGKRLIDRIGACGLLALALYCLAGAPAEAADKPGLRITWADNYLTVRGDDLPGEEMKILYLEAYCRAGSTDRDWHETVVPHRTELVSATEDQREIKLRCTVADGVTVDHVITTSDDEVDFRLTAHNPSDKRSEVHWAQPCIRVDRFTGRKQDDYLPNCFVFVDGALTRFPFEPWAKTARYTPGQVWCPRGVPRSDVNPRPLSDVVPSNGLIGCYSADGKKIMATAFEPYQELFQGVIVCVHADFRLGGLQPNETKQIHGKLYLVDADVPQLLERYRKDFPEQQAEE
jgi:hypothetical protein